MFTIDKEIKIRGGLSTYFSYLVLRAGGKCIEEL